MMIFFFFFFCDYLITGTNAAGDFFLCSMIHELLVICINASADLVQIYRNVLKYWDT